MQVLGSNGLTKFIFEKIKQASFLICLSGIEFNYLNLTFLQRHCDIHHSANPQLPSTNWFDYEYKVLAFELVTLIARDLRSK